MYVLQISKNFKVFGEDLQVSLGKTKVIIVIFAKKLVRFIWKKLLCLLSRHEIKILPCTPYQKVREISNISLKNYGSGPFSILYNLLSGKTIVNYYGKTTLQAQCGAHKQRPQKILEN